MNELLTADKFRYDIQKNLYFSLASNYYAVPIENVIEVMKLPYLDYPQNMPNNIVGVLKYNNIVINIIDIRFHLGLKVTKYSILNKLVIVKTDESMFGLIADDVENIVDFDTAKIENLPFSAENKIVNSLYNINNENVSILNLYALEQALRENTNKSNVDIQSLMPDDSNSITILKERALYLNNKTKDLTIKNTFSNNMYVSFYLNETLYSIDIKNIKEITTSANMIPIPCTPDYISGLITVRGDFITVLNLKSFLNVNPSTYKNKSKVIIINSDVFKIGFMVDDIHDISGIYENDATKNISNNSYIKYEIVHKNDITLILDINKILEDKKINIEEK